jgi:hypothetical protein
MSKLKQKAKELKKNQKDPISGKNMTLLGIMGILGLIFIVTGIYEAIAVSLPWGVALIVIGVLVYVAFVVIEKKLKLL